MGVNGSQEYALTWREQDMPAGPPICALRARARPTYDNGYTGWPTARETDGEKNVRTLEGSLREIERKGGPQDLCQAAQLAGWATPTASDAGGKESHNRTWSRTQVNLHNQVLGRGKQSDGTILTGWATPTTRDHKDGATDLEKAGVPVNCLLGRQVSLASGTITPLSPAATTKSGALDPAFSRWLMGYPAAWDDCAATAMPSSRR
jgi:hypothetical protein